MFDPDRKPERPSRTTNIAVAVMLTVFAIPVLLVAGCFPAVLLTAIVPNNTAVMATIAGLAIALCAGLAYHAGTPGYRIGFIIAAIEIVLFCGWLFWFSPFR